MFPIPTLILGIMGRRHRIGYGRRMSYDGPFPERLPVSPGVSTGYLTSVATTIRRNAAPGLLSKRIGNGHGKFLFLCGSFLRGSNLPVRKYSRSRVPQDIVHNLIKVLRDAYLIFAVMQFCLRKCCFALFHPPSPAPAGL